MAKQEKKAAQAETENVMVVNIKYSPTLVLHRKPAKSQSNEEQDIPIEELPDVLELTIPAKVYEQRNSPDYFDIVESFVYNLVSTMYNRVVTYCQIYFP